MRAKSHLSGHFTSKQRAGSPVAGAEVPQVGDVLGEIGLILAVHLAGALAISLILQAVGVA
jgi:hypothetical protein